MARSEVYSWRLAPEVKDQLEAEARREGISVASLLERLATEWLAERRGGPLEDERERRIRKAASRAIGAIAGGDPYRAERAREEIRRRLRARRER